MIGYKAGDIGLTSGQAVQIIAIFIIGLLVLCVASLYADVILCTAQIRQAEHG